MTMTCADSAAYWMVDLGAGAGSKQHTITIVSVLNLNRWDSWSGKKKILNANVEILDDGSNVVASQNIGVAVQEDYTFDFGGVQGR